MKPTATGSAAPAVRPESPAAVDLTIQDLFTGYGRAEVLHGVSLNVPTGKVTTVLGRNGVGKTTLLRCLSGLLPVRQGRVLFGGTEISRWSSSRRVSAGLAHVPEGRRMVPGFTVRQNLLLGAYVLSRREIEPRLAEIIALFPVISKWLGRECTSLSGGQQQLVAIARALMSRPRVLLLDEPLTGLHPSIAAEVVDSVQQLADQGLTILLVEQNVHLAVGVAHSVCVVDAGRVAMLDETPREDIADEIERVYLGVELPGVDEKPGR